ncbi:MAG: acetylxylan esterase [Akkermansiaceae bacterium]
MKTHARSPLFIFFVSFAFFANDSLAEENSEHGWKAKVEHVENWSKNRGKESNFDEAKVPAYELPALLVSENGQRIGSAEEWSKQRRPELRELFRKHVYGLRPQTPFTLGFKELSREDDAFGIGAIGRQIAITIKSGGKSHSFEFVMVVPKSDGPVPLVVLINNRRFISLNEVVEKNDPFWPVEQIVRKGYATASFHTSDVDPDKRDKYENGIRALLDDPKSDSDTRWGSLSAWGWGASRVLDCALEHPGIDASRTAVVGHSRGGKTALWAAAEDERFKIAYSNNSGCGGAALFRRSYGETIARINRVFPHWFCNAFNSYNVKANDLPVDQHQLVALIAPRAVYVASADEDLWADPLGEYTSLAAAAPVFELLGKKSVKNPKMPALNEARHVGSTGYHIRDGKHNLIKADWDFFLEFTEGVFKP